MFQMFSQEQFSYTFADLSWFNIWELTFKKEKKMSEAFFVCVIQGRVINKKQVKYVKKSC